MGCTNLDSGAETPPKFNELNLQNTIASFLHLSTEEKHTLNKFDVKACDELLQEWVGQLSHPTGSMQITKQDILSMFLVYQQRTQLLNSEPSTQRQKQFPVSQENVFLASEASSIFDSCQIESFKVQNACLLHEVQKANKKALHYLGELHSAQADLCSHKEELLRLKSELLVPPVSLSRCDSGLTCSPSPPLNESLTSPPIRRCEEQHLSSPFFDTDNGDICSMSSSRFSAPCSFQSLTPVTDTCHPEKGVTTSQVSPAHPLRCSGGENSGAAFSPPNELVASNGHIESNSAFPSREMVSKCPRFELLDLLAQDIQQFDPGNHHIENYLSTLDYNLKDLPQATDGEKRKLLWKTSSTAVHKFIQSQTPTVRDDYVNLCKAMTEEFSPAVNEVTSIVAALKIKQARREHPREFYMRLRHAYFQGRNAPGLEETSTFKSLFVHNLHPCVRTHVKLRIIGQNPSLREIRTITRMIWEVVITPRSCQMTEPARSDIEATHRPHAFHPHNPKRGGIKTHSGDEHRHRHPQLRRDRHSHNRSMRKPYTEILAQKYDQASYGSEDDHSISEYSSESGDDHNTFNKENIPEYPSSSVYSERSSSEQPQMKRYHTKRVRTPPASRYTHCPW